MCSRISDPANLSSHPFRRKFNPTSHDSSQSQPQRGEWASKFDNFNSGAELRWDSRSRSNNFERTWKWRWYEPSRSYNHNFNSWKLRTRSGSKNRCPSSNFVNSSRSRQHWTNHGISSACVPRTTLRHVWRWECSKRKQSVEIWATE